ncbi:putative undecaprenyl-phosphate N-acetylglucosaminyl 1-phosphate transferase [Limihaloglobus sulfuriphilus]|uniref:Putative undecaprenyl-phosphate N-acetylglucosaminyl 1-phosphate transferase n=1 Tax=Limihaloglobus sulfuriphilus TaxID=1851148 RepID=A0A1Q2MC39_9BACT|nr:MraY family glycosyltransferase [Limihaloglobus sulfuriphilus]AQQ70108.1 putative undecaprenyl-phosphate N-acetylglucosaminyl 1-phosphate transferase [Limihaloglobus sulfuriphilus]
MQKTITFCFISAAAALIFSAVLSHIVRKTCEKKGFVAHPQKDRYHTRTVALGGGIAIVFSSIILGTAAVVFETVFSAGSDTALMSIRTAVIFAICGLLLHVIGLYDDIKHTRPPVKLVLQFIPALLCIFFTDTRIELFIESRIVTTLLTAIWLVLFINVFNFLDNMDGLTSGIAAITGSIVLTATIISGQIHLSLLLSVFIGSLIGFLVFNFPPAKIFMGDCGSMYIGYFMAFATIRADYFIEGSDVSLTAVFIPLIIMAVPLYDFASVTLLRISQGRSPFQGDTQHFSHRLKRRGLSDKQVALTLYLATLCTSISAVFLYKAGLVESVLIFAHTIMILSLIAILEMANGKESISG